jgi:hypothetical protein
MMTIRIFSMFVETSSTHTIPVRNASVALGTIHRTCAWNAGSDRLSIQDHRRRIVSDAPLKTSSLCFIWLVEGARCANSEFLPSTRISEPFRDAVRGIARRERPARRGQLTALHGLFDTFVTALRERGVGSVQNGATLPFASLARGGALRERRCTALLVRVLPCGPEFLPSPSDCAVLEGGLRARASARHAFGCGSTPGSSSHGSVANMIVVAE